MDTSTRTGPQPRTEEHVTEGQTRHAPAAPARPDTRADTRADTKAEGPGGPGLDDGGLDRRARDVPRLGRLLTTIEQLRVDVRDWDPPDADDRRRRVRADELLGRAAACALACRVDDGWAYLNAANRRSLARLDDVTLRALVPTLRLECASKLTGWRAEAAAVCLAEPAPADRAELLSRVTSARELLDDDSQNTYLRLRLLGRRVAVATALLAAAMVGLTAVVLLLDGGTRDVLGDSTPVLVQPAWFVQVALLGALGAMLSAAISAMDHGSAPRVYELSTPLLATAVARVLVGSGAAVVTVMAAEVQLLPVKEEWIPLVAVVSGFSERLVRRVVATLSAAAEHSGTAPTARS